MLLAALDCDCDVAYQGGYCAKGCQGWCKQKGGCGARYAEVERNLKEGAAFFGADAYLAHIPVAYKLLELGYQLIA